MKLSNSYFYTLRENPKDEDSVSGSLLVRAGFIKKVGAGIYMFMPNGLKTLSKIEGIIKEEMDNAGAQELLMPSLIPMDYYEASGRADAFGNDMFKVTDRYNKLNALGPTHEELFTIAAKQMVKSYKDLPFTIYQQADKFRDEPRPRYGLIRVREFIMKDAYSFDKDKAGLDVSYGKMKQAYNNIYDRLGIKYKIVTSATGAMGGDLSEEYQAITDIGEDVIVLCDKCGYSANIEVAHTVYEKDNEEELPLEMVETPESKTIEEVANYLGIDPKKTVKALLMSVDGEFVTFFIRGDRELNEDKVLELLHAKELGFANDELIATSNAVPGYTGPIKLNSKIVIDEEVLTMKNFIVGANKEGYHYKNCNVKDFKYDVVGNIALVVESDTCPECGGKLYFKKGIEVGNLFKLGTKYSKALNLKYLDENNKAQDVEMGCYGIGPGRILASIVEQNNDENGLILPKEIAPFKLAIVMADFKDENQVKIANDLYEKFNKLYKNDVLFDDRKERCGVKFKDMDLIGIPVRITVGKMITENKVEVKLRTEKEFKLVDLNELDSVIEELLK